MWSSPSHTPIGRGIRPRPSSGGFYRSVLLLETKQAPPLRSRDKPASLNSSKSARQWALNYYSFRRQNSKYLALIADRHPPSHFQSQRPSVTPVRFCALCLGSGAAMPPGVVTAPRSASTRCFCACCGAKMTHYFRENPVISRGEIYQM